MATLAEKTVVIGGLVALWAWFSKDSLAGPGGGTPPRVAYVRWKPNFGDPNNVIPRLAVIFSPQGTLIVDNRQPGTGLLDTVAGDMAWQTKLRTDLLNIAPNLDAIVIEDYTGPTGYQPFIASYRGNLESIASSTGLPVSWMSTQELNAMMGMPQ